MFRRVVLRAYEQRCAVTGLRLINGGGRAEVEAAHIRPVEANGPDIISNRLALSGTAHWMFDRGLNGIAKTASRHKRPTYGALGREGGASLFPFDRPRRLAGNVIRHPIDPLDLIDDAIEIPVMCRTPGLFGQFTDRKRRK